MRATLICWVDEIPLPELPVTSSSCPNAVHDHPLPPDYIAASQVAVARLRLRWTNLQCPECGRYGWAAPKTEDWTR